MVGGTTKQSISRLEIASLTLARTRFNNMSRVSHSKYFTGSFILTIFIWCLYKSADHQIDNLIL